MTDDADPFGRAQQVADAVLWEGYVLYPYRASAAKNQVRWQYGVLAPRAFSEADGYERWTMQTECILDFGLEARVDVRLRFLQVQARTVEEAVAGDYKPVAELEVDGELWASWDEAVEHSLDVPRFDLTRPGVREVSIALDGGRELELLGRARSRRPRAVAGARSGPARDRALPGAVPADQAEGDGGERHRRLRAPGTPRPGDAPVARRGPHAVALRGCPLHLAARASRVREGRGRDVQERRNVPGARRRTGRHGHRAVIPDHPLRLPLRRCAKPGRHVRRHRDRRDPRVAHPDVDR